MEVGMVGLGRMGASMAQRLLKGGHRVVGFDPLPAATAGLQAQGAETVDALAALVALLPPPRVVWLMVPAGAPVDSTLALLMPLLEAGDTLIDGGNSHYADSQRRAKLAATQQLAYVDCGTSGGIWGLSEGYCLMLGGEAEAIEVMRPLFETLAPAPTRGWGRVGPSGAGHFSKMIHNGIEYALMQAYAEGFAILQHKPALIADLPALAEIWRHGSVVRSWLLDLTAEALKQNPTLAGIAPYVSDSGEGRWTVAEAIALDVSAPAITLSLLERLHSRDANRYSDKLLAALRQQFGGHAIQSE